MNSENVIPMATYRGSPLIPEGFAQQAMASVLHLHQELMAEKNKHIDLQKQLGDKEKRILELEQYIQLLEDRLVMAGVPKPSQKSSSEPDIGDLVMKLARSAALREAQKKVSPPPLETSPAAQALRAKKSMQAQARSIAMGVIADKAFLAAQRAALGVADERLAGWLSW